MERIADILKTLERYKRYENDGISLQPHEGRYVKDIEYLLAENKRLRELVSQVNVDPGRNGEPHIYLGNYPVAELYDTDRFREWFQALKQE